MFRPVSRVCYMMRDRTCIGGYISVDDKLLPSPSLLFSFFTAICSFLLSFFFRDGEKKSPLSPTRRTPFSRPCVRHGLFDVLSRGCDWKRSRSYIFGGYALAGCIRLKIDNNPWVITVRGDGTYILSIPYVLYLAILCLRHDDSRVNTTIVVTQKRNEFVRTKAFREYNISIYKEDHTRIVRKRQRWFFRAHHFSFVIFLALLYMHIKCDKSSINV